MHSMHFQLNMAREWFIDVAESCSKEIVDIQLHGFNNTIRWQAGHILTVAERMLFQGAGPSQSLPSTFTEWFDAGSKPGDWVDQPPPMSELILLLKRQQERLLAIDPAQFEVPLDPPLFGLASYGECAGFVVVHESFHAGKMEEMQRRIKHSLNC